MKKVKESTSSSSIVALYLVVYNVICFGGWFHILSLCLHNTFSSSVCLIWRDTSDVLKIIQTAAFLEVFHSYFKLTKSPVKTTVMQVGSRVFYVWIIFAPFSDVVASHDSKLITSCYFTCGVLTSWALVEVIRYSFYTTATVLGSDHVPYFMLWLRYSAFLLLYVTGIISELGVIVHILTHSWVTWSTSSLFHQVLTLIILLFALLYVPGAPTMYSHMLKARKKQLGGGNDKKK